MRIADTLILDQRYMQYIEHATYPDWMRKFNTQKDSCEYHTILAYIRMFYAEYSHDIYGFEDLFRKVCEFYTYMRKNNQSINDSFDFELELDTFFIDTQ